MLGCTHRCAAWRAFRGASPASHADRGFLPSDPVYRGLQWEQADRVYAGFWTNRGDCTDEMGELLAGLAGKEVFLFGTCGFGADETYFAGVAARAATHLPESAQVVGTFMCQGRMPSSVRRRYEHTAAQNPAQAARMAQLIANFDEAAAHPNDDDLVRLRAKVQAALSA